MDDFLDSHSMGPKRTGHEFTNFIDRVAESRFDDSFVLSCSSK